MLGASVDEIFQDKEAARPVVCQAGLTVQAGHVKISQVGTMAVYPSMA